MGTLSLIFGIIGIGIAVGFALYAFLLTDFMSIAFEYSAGIALISGGIGAYLIQRYNEDEKKSKN